MIVIVSSASEICDSGAWVSFSVPVSAADELSAADLLSAFPQAARDAAIVAAIRIDKNFFFI